MVLGAPEEESALPRFVGTPDPRRAFVRLAAERLEAGDRVVVAAADGREAGRLARLVQRETGTAPEAARGWDEALAAAPGALATVAAPLPAGFRLPGLAVVAAADVLGRRETAGAGPTDAAAFLPSGFHVGDRVVHADHGVAVLCGLEPVAEGGGEYLVLEYAGGHRALVPALEIDRLWRYGSAESEAPLDRLEGEAWTKRRAEVEAEIDEAARTLARVAAERARRKAPALVPDRRRYARFAGRFPYAPTDDQAAAIDATLADLARGAPPMDRLVCGDVGYGKTEVALRAAAAAALAGKQVAVLAPTTVLVRQHLTTFRRRFAGLGVRVEQLSRLARTAEARATREGLADGSVQIVVGTHALASPGVRFKDLGLVVIDEEQRFGTRQKGALAPAAPGRARPDDERHPDPAHAPVGAGRHPGAERDRDAAGAPPAGPHLRAAVRRRRWSARPCCASGRGAGAASWSARASPTSGRWRSGWRGPCRSSRSRPRTGG